MKENKLFFLESTDKEFEVAFSHFPDKTMYNEVHRECLQYMGSVMLPTGLINHEFRHRALPGNNERKYWKIPASLNFNAAVKSGEKQVKWFPS